jgi:hypothetical protein
MIFFLRGCSPMILVCQSPCLGVLSCGLSVMLLSAVWCLVLGFSDVRVAELWSKYLSCIVWP